HFFARLTTASFNRFFDPISVGIPVTALAASRSLPQSAALRPTRATRGSFIGTPVLGSNLSLHLPNTAAARWLRQSARSIIRRVALIGASSLDRLLAIAFRSPCQGRS